MGPRSTSMRPRGGPTRILVVGGNTFENKGDAALLLALDEELRRVLPDAEVSYSLRAPNQAREELTGRRLLAQPVTAQTAIGARTGALAVRLDPRLTPAVAVLQAQLLARWVRVWSWLDRYLPGRLVGRLLPRVLRRLVAEVRAVDIVILAPGGYMLAVTPQDVGWIHAVAPVIVANALGVPTAVAPSTIGPIPAVQRPAARLALGAARLVLLREGRSTPWARRCGVAPKRIGMSADMAWITTPAPTLPADVEAIVAGAPGSGPLLGLALRDFSFPRAADPMAARERYLDALASAVDRLVDERGVRPVFVGQALKRPLTDLDVAREVMARMRHPASIVERSLTARELSALYARMELVVGVRMHAGILAMAGGTPFVAVAYGIKHVGIMEDLGLARYLTLIDDLEVDWLVDAVTAALDAGPQLRALLEERVPDLQARVRRGSERLAATIRDAASRAPTPSND